MHTDKERLLASLNKAMQDFESILHYFNEEELNFLPGNDGWSPAQVADHVTKSNNSINKALQLTGTAINRAPDEGVAALKKIFLDFSTQLQSPDFILPSKVSYQKDDLITLLKNSAQKIIKAGNEQDLAGMINHPAFGDITKLEILHFVLYHTQRHINQLEKLKVIIKKSREKV